MKTVNWSSSVWVATPLREVTSFMADTKSATRVTSARSSELRLSCAPVSTSCSRMLPSRSRSNRATVSVRRILLVSCISVTAAIETWRDWSIAEREDCSRSFSDLLTAPVASSPAEVMVRATSEPLVDIDLREGLAAGFDRFQRVGRDAVDIERELAGLGADGLDQRSALAVDHLRQPIGLLLDVGDDFVGLAGHGGAERAAGGENRAFDVRRGRLDLRADFVRAATSALCALSAVVWMLSVVFAVTAMSERSISVEIALIWLAASAEVAVSELCASRALFRIEAAVSAPTAVKVRSTSIASDLT